MSFATKNLQIKHNSSFIKRASASINEFAVPALYLVVLLAIIVLIVGKYFPKVGHDYGFFIPRMLDTHLHHKINGLGIQWYTPNFAAGTPAYPNPQYVQYSLPQFLMFVVNPWTALMLSLITYAVMGFTGFYLFLRFEMGWINNAAALGASFIIANGFFVDHAIAGHVGFQGFPLLGAIFFLLFSKRINSLLAGILIGFVVAMIVNQAGFIILIIFALSLLITLPVIYLLRSDLLNLKFFITALLGGFSAVLLSISKVSAVIAFMRFFPRLIEDDYGKTYTQGLIGLLKQLTAFSFIIPYHLFTDGRIEKITLFFQKATGTDFGVWENNISLSPGLIILLLLGAGFAIFSISRAKRHISMGKGIVILLLGLAIWLVIDMSLAQGWLFGLVKSLPVISSLHANIRYTAAFIFPLAILGALIFHEIFKDRNFGNQAMFVVLALSALGMLSLYFVIPQDTYDRSYKISSSLATYAKIDKGWNPALQKVSNITDIETFDLQSSNLVPQDPIFGYQGEYFKPQVIPGPIMEIRDGHYNMTNPASYVFPKENNLQPFEPFRANQKADLELFIDHKQPNLKISTWQRFADGLNMAALIAVILYLIFELTKGSIRVWQTISPHNYPHQRQVL